MFNKIQYIAALVSVPWQSREGNAHDFNFDTIAGDALSLADYKGKVVLVVNTASECGFTPQYKQLQTLWETYRDQGLVIVGVPCNDFGGQEKASNASINSFCELNFGVTFPLAAKTKVKGKGQHPFYSWAGQQVGFLGKPRWNFHKFLVNKDGKLVDWFSSTTKPDARKLVRAIERELAK
ncbi:glutathione peroxidase [Vibrio hangzhouensis]|uniref:glutathione peroxidase n=1 Tax=Vibrio hangzhouensis TaxID=462991 RepID=UPI001C9488DC|nr:glutathione peroxidase [Vibrio hangzhouensis]MBY6195886.1 glutathione peroxidase [Vibrio hangzhouensis]